MNIFNYQRGFVYYLQKGVEGDTFNLKYVFLLVLGGLEQGLDLCQVFIATCLHSISLFITVTPYCITETGNEVKSP